MYCYCYVIVIVFIIIIFIIIIIITGLATLSRCVWLGEGSYQQAASTQHCNHCCTTPCDTETQHQQPPAWQPPASIMSSDHCKYWPICALIWRCGGRDGSGDMRCCRRATATHHLRPPPPLHPPTSVGRNQWLSQHLSLSLSLSLSRVSSQFSTTWRQQSLVKLAI